MRYEGYREVDNFDTVDDNFEAPKKDTKTFISFLFWSVVTENLWRKYVNNRYKS